MVTTVTTYGDAGDPFVRVVEEHEVVGDDELHVTIKIFPRGYVESVSVYVQVDAAVEGSNPLCEGDRVKLLSPSE